MPRRPEKREDAPPENPSDVPAGTPQTKKQIRLRMLERRDEIPYSEVLSASMQIREHLRAWKIFRAARCVCCYISVRSEMSTSGVILRALESGKTVLAPKVFGETIRFFRIRNLTDDLERGTFGVLEPTAGTEEADPARDADLCLIPGVAFDARGNRIGYGKGYFDRFLKTLPPRVPTLGLAYDCQLLDAVPADADDVPVQYLVTPSRGVFPAKK